MTMKITKLPTYWDASDAQLVIGFLDDLRDLLVAAYGDEINEMHQRLAEERLLAESQLELLFDDSVEF